MAIIYFIEASNISDTSSSLFDIKTISTSFGKDIDLASGTLSRLIGLDKLKQQVTKAVLVEKGSYDNVPGLGVRLLNTKKDLALASSSLRESLSTYTQLQQQQEPSSIVNVLGKNVYRTVDIDDATSWTKVNDYILSDNFFIDTELVSGTTYYYAITTVYRDSTNSIKETPIIGYQSIVITTDETLSSKVNFDFILVNGANQAKLYWNLPIELALEEQLRSILDIKFTQFASDPRGLRINVKVTNRERDSIQI